MPKEHGIDYIPYLISATVTLIGVYIGYLLSSRTAKKTVRLQEFNKAASIFSSEFHQTISNIRHNVNGAPAFQFLSEDVRRHEIAMMKFRPYLPAERLESFDAAWRDYAYPYDDKPGYTDMSPYKTQGVKEIKSVRSLAIKRIERILEFAKPI